MSDEKIILPPMDEYNRELLSRVHPSDRVDPRPADGYDLVVIGAGTAGLVIAAGAAGLDIGLKVALVEKNLMGGDCLNFGCVPSKCVIRSSRILGELQKAKALGIDIPEPIPVDFPKVMARTRKVRAEISYHDSVERFQKLGIDVFLGSARFLGDDRIEVNGQILRYRKAAIATGTRAARPAIAGLETAGFHTNETIFSLTELPGRLAVIGGGPIGCELAQAFHRLGSRVILFHKHVHLLNKEDTAAAEILHDTFTREGIELILPAGVQRVEKTAGGKVIHYTRDGRAESVVVDEILVGAGRVPNVEGLNLEAVGVKSDARAGVIVNDYLQTANPKIYAAGDICTHWKFTHAADAAARIVLKNLFFSPFGLGRYKLGDLVMPRVTYTDPEIASVGLNEGEARSRGIEVSTLEIPLSSVDRAMTDGETEGFVKILHVKGSDRILGATIVSSHAGETISEITAAIVHKIGLNGLSQVIHPYPTQAEGIKKAADAYRRSLLTDNTKRFLKFLSRLS